MLSTKNKIIWVEELSPEAVAYIAKWGRWPKYHCIKFKATDGKITWDGLMGEKAYESYKAEQKLLLELKSVDTSHWPPTSLLKAIDEFGDARHDEGYDEGYHEAEEAWAESEVGASV